jgi:hypothetical protein
MRRFDPGPRLQSYRLFILLHRHGFGFPCAAACARIYARTYADRHIESPFEFPRALPVPVFGATASERIACKSSSRPAQAA